MVGRIRRAHDAEAPVEERRDVERQLLAVEDVVSHHPVCIESLVLAKESNLAEDDVVEHRVEVRARRSRRVVHDLVGDELRFVLSPILEHSEELRGKGVRDDGQTVNFGLVLTFLFLELELGIQDELAVRGIREVRVRVDLPRHEHRAVHREAAMPAHHRLAAHFHGRSPERAENSTKVRHEERFLAQAELVAPVEVPTIAVELGRVRLVLELHEEAEVRGDSSGDEELDLVGWLELHLGLSRRLAVLEQAARDTKGEAVDHRLESPVVLEASDEAVRTRRARNLKAHHVELLPEPVQARRPRVAGVALHVVLARERGDRVDGSCIDVCQQHSCENGREERTPEHALSLSLEDTETRRAARRGSGQRSGGLAQIRRAACSRKSGGDSAGGRSTTGMRRSRPRAAHESSGRWTSSETGEGSAFEALTMASHEAA